jgi:sugar lactone lactonase YvrE
MQNHACAGHPRGRTRRKLIVVASVGAFAAVSTTSAGVADVAVSAETAAGPSATRIYTLPGEEVFAEGVAVAGDTYYVTGVGSATIYRGDLERPEVVAEPFAADADWGPMVGIKVVGEYLLVARDGSGSVSLHDRHSGAVVARWTNHVWPNPTNINDIAIAPNGDAYITDSDLPLLYRIPAADLRNPSPGVHDLPVFLEWRDPPYSDYVPPYLEANGIVATPDGRFVLVVHFSDGILFRVRLSDKQVTQVDVGGYRLISGDGMVITDDRVLYVVRPFGSLVVKLRLDSRYSRGRLLSETRDPTFHGPTTAAIARDRLLVVNSQFAGPPPAAPWTVSSIPIP